MDFDFCIVGGGVAGVSAAAQIAPLGTTLVLEAEDALAYHASGRSAAVFEPRYGAATVVELNYAGESYFDTAHGGVLSPRGIMMVCRPGEEIAFAREADQFELSEMSIDEACATIPILNREVIIRAAQSPVARDIDTDLLIQNYLRQARGAGAEVRLKAPVTSVERLTGGWRITAAGTEVRARVLVNAAGAWADGLAVMAGVAPIGLQPYRRSMARIPAPGGHDVSKWPMLFGVGETWYAKPDAGQLLVSPADEDPMEPMDAWPDDMVLAEGIARYSEVVTTEVTRLTTSWAGLRTFALDRTLVIGFDPKEDGFFWIAGQGGYGFQTSYGASVLASDLIAGRPPSLSAETVNALSPARFR